MEFLQVRPTFAVLQEENVQNGLFTEPLRQEKAEDREEGDRQNA